MGTQCRLAAEMSMALTENGSWNESSAVSSHIILGVAMGVGSNGKGRSSQTLSESVSEIRGPLWLVPSGSSAPLHVPFHYQLSTLRRVNCLMHEVWLVNVTGTSFVNRHSCVVPFGLERE